MVAGMPEITIYTKPWCGYCWRVKRLLDAKGATYHELDVTEDARIEAEMISRSGRTTAPQIFVDDVHIGDSAMLAQLERDGKLNTILADGCEASEGK
jgi:glutaredoxin 3